MDKEVLTLPLVDQRYQSNITQRHFLFGSRTFVLGERNIRIEESTLLRSSTTVLPLEILTPYPIYFTSFSRLWALIAMIAVIITIMVFFTAEKQQVPLLLNPGVLCAVFTLFVLWQCYVSSVRLIFFRDNRTNEPLLFFWQNRPSHARLLNFLIPLNRAILRNQMLKNNRQTTVQVNEAKSVVDNLPPVLEPSISTSRV